MKTKVLGIVNIEPTYVNVEGIENYRPISATSFMGRYRVIDFILSNFTNSGIYNIDVQVKNRPRSTISHIQHTNYNINTKRGNIMILHGEKNIPNEIYNTDIASLMANLKYFEENSAPYVILAPSHFIYVQDFRKMIEYHIKSKNDITMLYQNTNRANEDFLMCDTLEINSCKHITKIEKNLGKTKREKISLETYIMSKKTFTDLVYAAVQISSLYSLSDIITEAVSYLKIGAYCHSGYAACISSLKTYYNASMEIKREKELHNIFNDNWPIYTVTNDTCPTLYTKTSSVINSVVGNGCIIEGTVNNCVIGRNVIIKQGSVIKDCVIMPDALINKDVYMERCVVDRMAIVTHTKTLKGNEQPLYVKRGDRV